VAWNQGEITVGDGRKMGSKWMLRAHVLEREKGRYLGQQHVAYLGDGSNYGGKRGKKKPGSFREAGCSFIKRAGQ